MKVGSYTISFPVFNVTTTVTHLTIRAPTVFERMILRLCNQHPDIPGIGSLTIRQIFEDILGVSDAEDLVGPSIENLLVLGVLNCESRAALMDQALSSYRLTAEGEDFYRRNRLPGRPKFDDVRHVYFALDDSVARVGKFVPNHASLFINPDLVQPNLRSLQTQIRETLDAEKHEWKTPNTEITELGSRVGKIEWENVQAELNCDSSGVLTISAPASPRLNNWLPLADSNLIWEQLLSEILRPLDEENENEFDMLDASIFKSAIALYPAQGRGQSATRVNQPLVQIVRDLALVSETGKEPIFFMSPDVSSPRASRRADGRLIVELPRPDDLPQGFARLDVARELQSTHLTLTGLAPIIWAGQTYDCLLNVVVDGAKSDRLLQKLLAAWNDGFLNADDELVELLPALWERPEVIMDRWLARHGHTATYQLLLDVGLFEKTFAQLSGQLERQWKPTWHEKLKRALALAIGAIPHDLMLPDLLAVLAELNKILVGQDISLLQSQLLTHAAAIQNSSDLEKVRSNIHHSLEIPQNLLGEGLVEFWITQAMGSTPLNLFGPHHLVAPLTSLRIAHEGLIRNIGSDSLLATSIGKLDASKITKNALHSISDWRSAMAKFGLHSPEKSDHIPELLRIADQQVEMWYSACIQYLAPSQVRRVVVFDTSAVMNAASILSRLTDMDYGVAPLRMLEELDGLKSSADEQQAYKARAAINAVKDAIHHKKLHLEAEHIELLPAEWGDTPDNRILTAALYYKLSDVLLVSDDKNLGNKTNAIGISLKSSSEFLGVTSQPKNDNQKKGKR